MRLFKHFVIFLLCLLFPAMSFADNTNSDSGSSVSKSGYTLVFSTETSAASTYFSDQTGVTIASDAFTSSFSDQTNLENYWNYCTYGTSTWKCHMSNYQAEQRQMQSYSDGTLCMKAGTVSSAYDGTSKFLTSGIQTNKNYKYGIFEVKAKCNKKDYNFPAIWLMPEDHASDDEYTVPWPVCGEIDVMEQTGNSNNSSGTVHTGLRYNNFGYSYTITGNKDVTDAAYHIYTLVWDETGLTWYIDGTQLWQYNKDTDLCEELQYQQFPYNKPYRIILDQAVNTKSATVSGSFEMDVAYVRIFQKTAGYTDPTCSFQNVTADKTYHIKASSGQVLAASSTSSGATVSGATPSSTNALQQWTVKGSAASGYYFRLANTNSSSSTGYYMQNNGTSSSVTTAAEEWNTNQMSDGAQEAQTFYYTSDNKLYTFLNDDANTKYYLVLSSTGSLSTTTSATSATSFTFEEPATTYIISCNSVTGGTVTASATSAVEGTKITLSNTPDSGYTFGEYIVKDTSDNEVEVTNNTFTMPASDVTVSATFSEIRLDLTDSAPDLVAGTYKAGNVTYTRTVNNYYAGFNVPFDVDLSKMANNFQAVYTPSGFAIYNPTTGILTTFYKRLEMSSTLSANTPFLAVMTTDSEGNKQSQNVCLISENETTFLSTTPDPTPVAMEVYDYGFNGGLAKTSTNYAVSYGGTLLSSTHERTDNFYIVTGADGSWGYVDGILRAFREYVIISPLSSDSAKPLTIDVSFDDGATSIDDIILESTFDDSIYDIGGRKVSSHYCKYLPKGIYIKAGKKFIVK